MLGELPEELLVLILRFSSPSDIALFRSVSRKFRDVIQRNRLARIQVDEFSVQLRSCEERTAPFGRIQVRKPARFSQRLVVGMKRKHRTSHVVREGPPNTQNMSFDDELKRVRLMERLSFDGLHVNDEFPMLHTKNEQFKAVTRLSFAMCKFSIDNQKMQKLIRETSTHTLHLDFCDNEHLLLNDMVLSEMPNLIELRVQPRRPVTLDSLTDVTLSRWTTHAPKVVQLRNCIPAFSLDNIILFAQKLPDCGEFDFGRINSDGKSSDFLLELLLTSGLAVQISDDFHSRRIEITKRKAKLTFNIINDYYFRSIT